MHYSPYSFSTPDYFNQLPAFIHLAMEINTGYSGFYNKHWEEVFYPI